MPSVHALANPTRFLKITRPITPLLLWTGTALIAVGVAAVTLQWLMDDRPPAEHLRARVPYTARSQYVPVERYTSRAWHELERTHLWRKVWQMACREEHLPEVGSYVVYEIAGDSYLVARTREGTIKAYVIPRGHDRARARKFAELLQKQGFDVHETTADATVGDRNVAAGAYVVRPPSLEVGCWSTC